jgi:hypothetical protein
MRADLVNLIKITYPTGQRDASGNQLEVESTPRELFCEYESVRQSEFFAASQQGLKAEYKLLVNEFDYEGEEIAVFKTKRYSIYRTYLGKDENIELYLGIKAGV